MTKLADSMSAFAEIFVRSQALMAKAPESVTSLATARVPDITTAPAMLTCPTLSTIAGGSVPWGGNSHEEEIVAPVTAGCPLHGDIWEPSEALDASPGVETDDRARAELRGQAGRRPSDRWSQRRPRRAPGRSRPRG